MIQTEIDMPPTRLGLKAGNLVEVQSAKETFATLDEGR